MSVSEYHCRMCRTVDKYSSVSTVVYMCAEADGSRLEALLAFF